MFKKINTYSVLYTLIVVFTPFITMADSASFTQNTYNLDPNANFDIAINVQDLSNADTVDIKIKYDTDVISYTGFTDGIFTDPAGWGVLTSASTDDSIETRLFSIPCDQLSNGTGTIITVSFTASSTPGSTSITMEDFKIYDPLFNTTNGNTGSPVNVTVLDNVNPTISITSPTGDATYSLTDTNNVLSVSGTSNDNVSVSSVTYSVNTGDAGNAVGTSTWSANVSLAEGENIITVTATDSTGNTSTDVLTVDYSVPDTTPPIISSLSPTGELNNGTRETTLSFLTDEYAICHYSDVEDASYDAMDIMSNTGGTSHSTVVTDLSDNSEYSYYVKCKDTNGNINTDNSIISFSVKKHRSSGGGGGGSSSSRRKRDNEAPKNISIKINLDKKITNEKTVTLTLNATDKSTPIKMQISNNEIFTNSDWINFSEKLKWTLAGKNGTKKVYVRFKDGKGNISKTISDSIYLLQKETKHTSVKQAVKGAQKFFFSRNMKFGTKGNDIKELQQRLREEGFFSYPTNTGYFGNVTLKAVKAYQKYHGIEQTGYVGPITRASLNKKSQSYKKTINSSGESISLKQLVNLLIALDLIPKEKVAIALSAVESI